MARREAEAKLELAKAKAEATSKPSRAPRSPSCKPAELPAEMEVTHYVATPRLTAALAVAMLALLAALAWYGGREIVNAIVDWHRKLAPVKTAPVVKVLPAAPRPPVPQKGNLSESIGWRQARAIAADEAAMVICVSGRSLLADRRLANGKWIAFAGDSRLTYDYVTQRWEQ